MTADQLINRAQNEGVEFRLNGAGEVECEMFEDLIPVWAPTLRQNKAGIVAILRGREHNVLRWLRSHCIGAVRVSVNTNLLFRKYLASALNNAVSRETFLRLVGTEGYVDCNGMVDGLCLAEDFLAAIGYERPPVWQSN